MATTEAAESDDTSQAEERRKRFVSAPRPQGRDADADDSEGDSGSSTEAAGPRMSRRAAISGVAMGAAALLCFVLAAGFSGGPVKVDEASAKEIFSLKEQITAAESKDEALPASADAERGLVTAQTSAAEIADFQNAYRYLSPQIAAADGALPDAADATLRALTPYFAPSVDQTDLTPWYLLASDKDVPAGTGLPMSFDSGFEWVAQRPYLISEDSTVRVTWLAVETRPAEGQKPAVLAWAHADYDLTRKTFSDVETGTTTTGEALRLEVKTS